MKILVSGFHPFGGMDSNPTEELLNDIQKMTFKSVEIETILLPVRYDESVDVILKEVERIKPDVVISCGLYRGRSAVTVERIAINVKDVMAEDPLPDKDGNFPIDEPINPDGPDGLFSNLPYRQITNNLKDEFIPAYVSNTAGTFICNNTLYGLLDYIRVNNLSMQAGFIHFPLSAEMVLDDPSSPNMPYETMVKALEVIIQTVIDEHCK